MQDQTKAINEMSADIKEMKLGWWGSIEKISEDQLREEHPIEKLMGYYVQYRQWAGGIIAEWPSKWVRIDQKIRINDGKIFYTKKEADDFGMTTFGNWKYRILNKTFYFSKKVTDARTFDDTTADRERDVIQGDKLEPVSYEEDSQGWEDWTHSG